MHNDKELKVEEKSTPDFFSQDEFLSKNLNEEEKVQSLFNSCCENIL